MEELFMKILATIITVVVGYLLWIIKRYQTKVDNLDSRVTKVETIMELLGDIRSDISTLRTDVEVIKTRLDAR